MTIKCHALSIVHVLIHSTRESVCVVGSSLSHETKLSRRRKKKVNSLPCTLAKVTVSMIVVAVLVMVVVMAYEADSWCGKSS